MLHLAKLTFYFLKTQETAKILNCIRSDRPPYRYIDPPPAKKLLSE
ncbi:MAG: hypothetical protein SXA11_12520 [Cyanobacteriota bacterium]|nr:hypothetical protein [Cyanobacteriota bacterium]